MPADIAESIQGLSDPSSAARAAAAEKLARLGPEAQVAAAPLVQAAGDAVEEVRQWATAALEEMGPPAAADGLTLAGLLGCQNDDVAYWAATLLGRLGDGKYVPQLAEALSADRAPAVRQRACWALGKLGPAAAAARGPLQSAAACDDPRLARLAQSTLDKLG